MKFSPAWNSIKETVVHIAPEDAICP